MTFFTSTGESIVWFSKIAINFQYIHFLIIVLCKKKEKKKKKKNEDIALDQYSFVRPKFMFSFVSCFARQLYDSL